MTWSYWTFVAGFMGVGLLADTLLEAVDSKTPFVSPELWPLLGIAIFVERYGAMHINLYSTTNHIIWHVANGVSGLVFVAVSVLLFPRIGVYAFPAGLLAGYLGFYAWYSALHSYRAFNLGFWTFLLKRQQSNCKAPARNGTSLAMGAPGPEVKISAYELSLTGMDGR